MNLFRAGRHEGRHEGRIGGRIGGRHDGPRGEGREDIPCGLVRRGALDVSLAAVWRRGHARRGGAGLPRLGLAMVNDPGWARAGGVELGGLHWREWPPHPIIEPF